MADRIILIDKPLQWTSFDVVKKLRKALLEEKKRELSPELRDEFKRFKVGHAGTLDPLATGLLILCTGKLTRKIDQIRDAEKEYTGSITLGSVTDSFDLETEPRDLKPFDHIKKSQILELAEQFVGSQLQTAPQHSAKKIDGQRAYDKARKGEEFELKPSWITIDEFEITSANLPLIEFRVVCSKGTYIRSLAHDFGKKLGTGGHLSALCRTRIGTYQLAEAVSPDQFLDQLVEKQILP